ncbi:MAG TPA: signal recognition particle-docking protein FtsY, partial [Actinomycetota bacterium]|nr:signal recognition particle-docking protein FtsY [Actinomycetota bacterium]
TMREAMRLVLEHEGFEIREAADGHAALRMVREDPPDLVFLDLNIPGTPGAEVLRALKEDPATASVRVVIVTATGEEGRRHVLSLGADEYFTKPFSPLALLRTVERVLQGGAGAGADEPLRLPEDRLAVVLVVGVNGSGKTTTIGKLAHRLAAEGRRVSLAAADTFRAAASEQLAAWAERAGAHLVAQQRGADPGAVAFDAVKAALARGSDVLIVDTAGRLHTKTPLMDELAKIRRVVGKAGGTIDETLLVLDATTGQNGIAQARAFTEAVEVTGLALAKLDGTAKGGIVLAVREELGVPVKLVGTGEGPADLEAFRGRAFAERLVRGSGG